MRFQDANYGIIGMMVSLYTDTNDKSLLYKMKKTNSKKQEENYKNQLETKSIRCDCSLYHLGYGTNECWFVGDTVKALSGTSYCMD